MTRIQRALKLQTQRIAKAMVLSLGLGALFSWTQLNSDSTFIHLLVAGLASYLVYIPLREFLVWRTIQDVYQGDVNAMRRDAIALDKQLKAMAEAASSPPVSQINLEIVAQSDTPMGSFKGFQYYENITIKAPDGTFWLFTFSGTMDIEEGITQKIGNDELLLHPGVLYKCIRQVEQPS